MKPSDTNYNWLNKYYRENIQQAAGTVIVQYNGKEYAVVADYHQLINEPDWQDLGFEKYYLGGMSHAVGGKIGIIEDPFGEARYLGATSPIEGATFRQLVLGSDGTLYADAYIDELTDTGSIFRHSLLTWDLTKLLMYATSIAHTDTSVPIDRMVNSRYSTQLVGTAAIRYDLPSAGFLQGVGVYSPFASNLDLAKQNWRDQVLNASPEGPLTMQTASESWPILNNWLAKLAFNVFDNVFTSGFSEERDDLIQKYNSGQLGYREYQQKVMQAFLVHAAITPLKFTALGRLTTAFTGWRGTTVAAAGAAADLISEKTTALLISALLGKLGEDIEQNASKTWQQSFLDITVDEISMLLGGVLGAGSKAAAAQEIKDLVNFGKNFCTNLANTLSLDAKRLLLGGASVVAMDASASSIKPSLGTATKATAKSEIRFVTGYINKFFRGSVELFASPAPQTMTVAEVTQWYRQTVANMANWVDKSLPLSEQVKEAKRINEFIMKSVKSAVYSQSAYQEFVAAAGAAIPSRSTMRAWKASPEFSGKTGQKQLEAILKKYTEIKLPVQKYEPACFAGGTLVHTKNGLVPIEQIQVGDWVLSKYESGEGEREYKRVTRTFVHEDRQVILLRIGGLQADGTRRSYDFGVTPEHPIWVQGKGWKEAGKIKNTFPDTKLELLSSENLVVGGNIRLFKTDQPDIAWSPLSSLAAYLAGIGKRIHVPSMQVVETDVFIGIDYVRTAKRAKPEHLYTTTVYNLEVEDFHTYYVGEPGIWVHNKNIQVSASAAPGYMPMASDLSRPFISRSELSNCLNKLAGQGTVGMEEATHKVFIVKAGSLSQGEKEGVAIAAEDWPRWLKFEEYAPGRLVDQFGQRYEYALSYYNPIFKDWRYLAIEGRRDANNLGAGEYV